MLQPKVVAPYGSRDTRWVEGVRGIASLFVVSAHLVSAYNESIADPGPAKGGRPAIYQLPIIRVFSAGGLHWVCMFIIMTGFVNSLKALKLARDGRIDEALRTLASSCLRRTSRLVLPCTIATFFAWILCEMGGFRIGSMVNSGWMRDTSPQPSSGSAFRAIQRFIKSIYGTWTGSGSNEFDKNQWIMSSFLRGSLDVFLILQALVRARPRYRMLISAALFVYSWVRGNTVLGMNIYTGVILAELSIEPVIMQFASSRKSIRVIPIFMVLTGLFFCGYPSKPETQSWSNALRLLGLRIFPGGEGSFRGAFSSLGAIFVLTGITLSEPLQGLLCHPVPLWLGARSFPIYLIHGPLLRSFLAWILYAGATRPWTDKSKDGETTRVYANYPDPPVWRFAVCLPIFYALLMWLAHHWQARIEPQCAAITRWLENTICGLDVEVPAPVVFEMSPNEHEQVSGRTSPLQARDVLPIHASRESV